MKVIYIRSYKRNGAYTNIMVVKHCGEFKRIFIRGISRLNKCMKIKYSCDEYTDYVPKKKKQ